MEQDMKDQIYNKIAPDILLNKIQNEISTILDGCRWNFEKLQSECRDQYMKAKPFNIRAIYLLLRERDSKHINDWIASDTVNAYLHCMYATEDYQLLKDFIINDLPILSKRFKLYFSEMAYHIISLQIARDATSFWHKRRAWRIYEILKNSTGVQIVPDIRTTEELIYVCYYPELI